MAFTTAWEKAQATDARYPYKIGIQIETDAGSWCDVNKVMPAAAADVLYNRLKAAPTIEVKSEVRPGKFATTISTLTLDDFDGAFGKQLPWSVWDINGTADSITAWYGARLRVRIAHHAGSASAWSWLTLGTFRIEDISRDANNRVATVKLVGLEKILIDAKAAALKTGDSWMINAPIPLIARRLVEAAGMGEITWEANSPPVECPLDLPEAHFSPLGNMPCFVGNPPVWNEHNDFVPRYQMVSATDASVIYFVGYSISKNAPAIARWDTDAADPANSWTYATYENYYTGRELVFAAQQATGTYTARLYIFAMNNQVMYADYSAANHYCAISHVNATTLAWGATVANISVYAFPVLSTDGITTYTHTYWASYDAGTAPYGGQNVPAFFRSHIGIPGYSSDGISCNASGIFNTDSSTIEPYVHVNAIHEVYGSSYNAYPDWEFQPGYYYFYSAAVQDPIWPARSPVTTQLSECFRYDSTRDCVYWVRWQETSDHFTGYWYLSRFSLESAGYNAGQRINHGLSGYSTATDFFKHCVTAFDLVATSASAGYVWVAFERLPYGVYNADTDRTLLHRYVFQTHGTDLSSPTNLPFTGSPGLAWSDEWTDAGVVQDYAPLIVTIRHNPANAAAYFLPLWGQVCNRRGALQHSYGLWCYTTAGDLSGGYVYHDPSPDAGYVQWPKSPSPFVETHTPFLISGAGATAHIVDQGTGIVYQITLSTGSTIFWVQMLRHGESCDEENTWQSCNLLYDSTGERLLGVSASNSPADCRMPLKAVAHWVGDPDFSSASPGGRLALWQYSSSLSDVIRVSDFGDDSAWDALQNLRMAAGNYVAGFNADGALAFRARASGSASYTIVKMGDNFAATDLATLGAESLTSSLDHSAMANSVTIKARIGTREPPTCELILTPDSTADDAQISVQYSDNTAQRIMLRCIQGGRPRPYASGVDSMPLLFSWSRPMLELSTSLRIDAYGTDSQIMIYGLYRDTNGNARLGEGVVSEGDIVYVGDGVARKIISGGVYVSGGMLYLDGAIGPDSSSVHQIGAAVRIIPIDRSRVGDSAEGIATVTSDFAVPTTTSRRTLDVDDTSHIRPGMLLYVSTAYVQVIEITSTTSLSVLGLRLGGGQGAETTWAVGTPVRAAIWVEWYNRSYPIGDSGATFSVLAPAKEVSNRMSWATGDRIIITCGGYALRTMQNAIIRQESSLSIERYGRKEYKLPDNHLLDQPRAIAVVNAMETEPTYLTQATGLPMVTTFSIGTVINVKNEYLFPEETNFTVAHEVVGIRHNLDTGLMDLTMRSLVTPGRSDDLILGRAGGPPREGVVTGWEKDTLHVRRREKVSTSVATMGVAGCEATAPSLTVTIT